MRQDNQPEGSTSRGCEGGEIHMAAKKKAAKKPVKKVAKKAAKK